MARKILLIFNVFWKEYSQYLIKSFCGGTRGAVFSKTPPRAWLPEAN